MSTKTARRKTKTRVTQNKEDGKELNIPIPRSKNNLPTQNKSGRHVLPEVKTPAWRTTALSAPELVFPGRKRYTSSPALHARARRKHGEHPAESSSSPSGAAKSTYNTTGRHDP